MNIGIIGSGNMGASMGHIWAKKGHKVLFSFSISSQLLQPGLPNYNINAVRVSYIVNTGVAATISAVSGNVVTLTGLTGMTAQSVGRIVYLSQCVRSHNQGVFLITAYISERSVQIRILGGVAIFPDGTSPPLLWIQPNRRCRADGDHAMKTDTTKATAGRRNAFPWGRLS